MKKLFTLAFALAFGTGLALAQSTATVNQDGTSNAATVDQSGGGHQAIVNQYGTNLADVDQYDGTGNTATIDQGTPGTPASNFDAILNNGWELGAFIEQAGSDNVASITMSSSDNGASIVQDGDRNEASIQITQTHIKNSTATGAPADMGADIDQLGDDNVASQEIIYFAGSGVSGLNYADIYQSGAFNVGTQYSYGGTSSGQQGYMELRQVGDNNNNATTSSNTFDVSATGMAPVINTAYTQYQYGLGTISHMFITGSDNQAFQYQSRATGFYGRNIAELDILGDANDVAQSQIGGTLTTVNTSDIDIVGSSNVVVNIQVGNSIDGTIDITGSSNVAGVQQLASGDIATVTQNGNGNVALVNQ